MSASGEGDSGSTERIVLAFRFTPIPDSANRWFYFVAESPDGAPGDAVTLWATLRPSAGANGQRYEDGLPAQGSLVLGFAFNGVGVKA